MFKTDIGPFISQNMSYETCMQYLSGRRVQPDDSQNQLKARENWTLATLATWNLAAR